MITPILRTVFNRRLILLCTLVLTPACAVDSTQLVVVVNSNIEVPAELAKLEISAIRSGGAKQVRELDLSETPLPLSFGVAPANGQIPPTITIEIKALNPAGDILFTRSVITGFISGKRLLIPIFLARRCLDEAKSCGPGQTCSEDGCIAANIDVTTLKETEIKAETTYSWSDIPPQPPTITITPAEPGTENDLTCAVTSSDKKFDGRQLRFQYRWLKDDEETNHSSATLSSNETQRSEDWTCLVIATDESAESAAARTMVTIKNTAPSIAAVVIEPDKADESSVLTCQGFGASDPDKDEIILVHQWRVNGDTPFTSTTIDGESFDRGDKVTCSMTPTDGQDSGATKTASVAIGNSVPLITRVRISPDSGTETTVFRCIPEGWTDLDGDSENYHYRWRVNGPATVLTATTITGAHFNRDDEVVCEISPDDGIDQGLTLTSTAVTIQNTPPTIQGLTLSPTIVRTTDDLTATVSGWHDADGEPENYEFHWLVERASAYVYSSSISQSSPVSALSHDHFMRGDIVKVILYAVDTATAVVSTFTTTRIQNSPPSYGGAVITPNSGDESTTFTCSGEIWADVDGDQENASLAETEWVVTTGTAALPILQTTLAGTDFVRGDIIECHVRPFDTFAYGPWVTAVQNVTIGNVPPSAPAVGITPANPSSGDDLNCVATEVTADLDGDGVTYTYVWSNGASTVSGFATLSSTITQVGDNWTCTVTPNDSFEDGASGQASVPIYSSLLQWMSSAPSQLELTRAEITVGQFSACVTAGVCASTHFNPFPNTECNYNRAGRGHHPMNCVNWTGAEQFCAFSKARLPTEDEWYAEASNSGLWLYPWGDSPAADCTRCVMNTVAGGGGGCGRASTIEACSFSSSGDSVSGICDMSGNVSEWTSTELGLPGPIRGGSWKDDLVAQSADSSWARTFATSQDDAGFRCVREFDQSRNDMTAFWRLNNNATDTLGVHHGTIYPTSGTPAPAPGVNRRGLADGAMTFNGSNYIEVDDHADLDGFAAFTVCAWVNPSILSGSEPNYIVTKVNENDSDISTESYALGIWGSSHSALGSRVEFSIGTSGQYRTVYSASDSGGRIYPGTWTHICGRYDGVTKRVYLNGEESGRASHTGQVNDTSSPLHIGNCNGLNNCSNHGLRGRIDDVKLWSRALSDAELCEESESTTCLKWIASAPAQLDFTKTEVTAAQYQNCIAQLGCSSGNHTTVSNNPHCNYGRALGSDHPMNCVNYAGATAFCTLAGGRLPNQAEWYSEASNAGNRSYPWGNAPQASCDYSVMSTATATSAGAAGCGTGQTFASCSKPLGNSVSGLCDMSGNTHEWSSTVNPSDSDENVILGGSFGNNTQDALDASAAGYLPRSFGVTSIGFRCVRHRLEHKWSRALGSAGEDRANEMAVVDAAGNIYVTGSFEGTVDFGGGDLTSAGSSDIFVASYTADGVFRGAMGYGGTGADVGYDLAFDENGNLYLTGSFASSTIVLAGVTLSGVSETAFLASWDSSGQPRWAKAYAGTATIRSSPFELVIDQQNHNLYLVGLFEGVLNFSHPVRPVNNLTSAGQADGFIVSFDSDGGHRWSKRFGGTGVDVATDIVLDSNALYLTGYFTGDIDGALSLTTGTSRDILLASFDLDGNLQWQTLFGGSDDDAGYALGVDSNNDIYLSGYFGGRVNFGGGNLNSAGIQASFLASYSSGGIHRWSHVLGGDVNDVGYAIALDAANNVYVTGRFRGESLFGDIKLASQGETDIFASSFSSTGVYRWAKAWGGPGSDEGRGLVLGANGQLSLIGQIRGSADFGGGSIGSGALDGFILTIDP